MKMTVQLELTSHIENEEFANFCSAVARRNRLWMPGHGPETVNPVLGVSFPPVSADEFVAADFKTDKGIIGDLEATWAGRRATANTRKEAEDLGRLFAADGKGLDDAPTGIKGNAKLLEAFQRGLGAVSAPAQENDPDDDLLDEKTDAEPAAEDDEPEQQSYDLDEMTDKADEVLEKLGKTRLKEIMAEAGCDEDMRRIKDIPEDLRGAVYRGWQLALDEAKAAKGKK